MTKNPNKILHLHLISSESGWINDIIPNDKGKSGDDDGNVDKRYKNIGKSSDKPF